MNILIACESSGNVRDAFLTKGHDVVSCDVEPTDHSGPHFKTDVQQLLTQSWDLLIGFPPCTYLCSSGIHRTIRGQRDVSLSEHAAEFFMSLWNANAKRICIENPVGIMSTVFRQPDQIIHPYEFGHDVSKRTCLWLKGLPRLKGTQFVMPQFINGKQRWGNQTPTGADKMSPSKDRAKKRSITYLGVAEAMADQWG